MKILMRYDERLPVRLVVNNCLIDDRSERKIPDDRMAWPAVIGAEGEKLPLGANCGRTRTVLQSALSGALPVLSRAQRDQDVLLT